MLIEAIRWLREAGLAVAEQAGDGRRAAGPDTVLDVSVGDRSARFAVAQRQRAPYPGELSGLVSTREALSSLGEPLLTAPYISQALGASLTEAGWSWADDYGDFDLRVPGLIFRQRRALTAPAARQRSLPRGSGSFAVIRALVGSRSSEEEVGATEIAARAGVSQPRASQVLHKLRQLSLVQRTGNGRWRPDREGLLDRFLTEYPGPGGSTEYFFGLEQPAESARRIAGDTRGTQLAVSADVGPDLISPWRRPSTAIIYARRGIEPAGLELVRASGEHDANVIVRIPQDLSVFPAHPLSAVLRGTEIPLSDPVQMIWDLENLGGADRMEAAEKLRRWLLTNP